jgi:hypothetical protein
VEARVEFSEYAAARRTSLVRSAVLLGCPEVSPSPALRDGRQPLPLPRPDGVGTRDTGRTGQVVAVNELLAEP